MTFTETVHGTINEIVTQVEAALSQNSAELQLEAKRISSNKSANANEEQSTMSTLGDLVGTAQQALTLFRWAKQVAEAMGFDAEQDINSLVNIVADEVKRHGSKAFDRMEVFVDDLRSDIKATAQKLARGHSKVHFNDSLQAVYHYRRLGDHFEERILELTVEIYLSAGDVPEDLMEHGNLVLSDTFEVCNL